MNRNQMVAAYLRHRNAAEALLELCVAVRRADYPQTIAQLPLEASVHATLALVYLTDLKGEG